MGLSVCAATLSRAQESHPRIAFDVASIRQNHSREQPSSNVPLGPGNVTTKNDGILRARNFSLLYYLVFAYKLTDYQEAALRDAAPAWLATDHFDIEAHTDDRASTKDQLRLMMRTLLAERFNLAVHHETRQSPVYVLVTIRSGVTGQKLRRHPADADCFDSTPASHDPDAPPGPKIPETLPGGFPTVCGGILGVPASALDRYSFGARNVPMSLIAHSLSSWGNLGRPVLDQTGLSGEYDFVLEYTPDPPPAYAKGLDSGGPSFQEALQKQLGLKLESQKGPVEFLVLDRIDRLHEN